MRVAVIGAGVIGVTTAYELGADGHEVIVFERRSTVAAESSFANAGLIAPGYVSPWSAPGMPGKVISHLFRAHAPVRFGGRPDLSTVGWLWRGGGLQPDVGQRARMPPRHFSGRCTSDRRCTSTSRPPAFCPAPSAPISRAEGIRRPDRAGRRTAAARRLGLRRVEGAHPTPRSMPRVLEDDGSQRARHPPAARRQPYGVNSASGCGRADVYGRRPILSSPARAGSAAERRRDRAPTA